MTHDRNTPLLTAALQAAERGWYVHPLRPGGKAPALHGEDDCPTTGACTNGHQKWEQRATLDLGRIRGAWAVRAFNVGIAPGPSGLVVVDLDMPKPEDSADTPSGVHSFEALCERAGQSVPTTYRVRTPSGGMHLYFTAPSGVRLSSSKGKLARRIDTRAWGGNVVAPGSIVNGQAYEVTDPARVAELPGWLLDALAPAPTPVQPVPIQVPRYGNRAADTALERELATVRATTEGGRNEQLLRSARAVGRFVAWGDLPRHVVEEAFQSGGESTGLSAAECRATIRSALNWSIRTCRPRPGTAA
ncbi:bifunctional DNA primase/polymerase [Streptomyces sp. AM 4-1-1]|uniref:bifunctional DNA primase/polymerase n=1 Tax=Streptomyces sp. AM 4-1-1 TaxID=3028710 RepID=UPI0023B8DF3B|nr:bifunctional DNA primase/polymerase [Streptomyces sp. AM 4-1-1]WEH34477.1 bifunctional DNA primase/polymerase [Streptomyces sp. AM 4-1-1]